MNIYSIYRITNLITKKVYIGYTSNPEARWRKHCINGTKLEDSQRKLYRSMLKHGLENFVFDIIYQSNDKNYIKNIMENYFIVEYNSLDKGYNMTLGGDGGDTSHSPKYKLGILRRAESDWRSKISVGRTGIKTGPQSKDHLQNRIQSRSGKPNVKRLTADQRTNMARSGKSNGHAKQWCFISPSNDKFTILGEFNQFCEDHNLESSGMRKIISTGKPAKRGKNLGWHVSEL